MTSFDPYDDNRSLEPLEVVEAAYDAARAAALARWEEIIEALLDCVNQACQVEYTYDKKCIVHNMGLSAYEYALPLLGEMGYARDIGYGRWELIWPSQRDAEGKEEILG